jgi:hypothetical protein
MQRTEFHNVKNRLASFIERHALHQSNSNRYYELFSWLDPPSVGSSVYSLSHRIPEDNCA